MSDDSTLIVEESGSIRLFDTRSSHASDSPVAEESRHLMRGNEDEHEQAHEDDVGDDENDDESWSRASSVDDERPSPLMKNATARRSHTSFYDQQNQAGSPVLLSSALMEDTQESTSPNVHKQSLKAKAGIILVS